MACYALADPLQVVQAGQHYKSATHRHQKQMLQYEVTSTHLASIAVRLERSEGHPSIQP